jgi:LmbE family N-acetylglucosaminyl deacetylase
MKETDIMFLGFPDGGISKMWLTNWTKNNPYFSAYTKTYSSPYNNSYGGKILYAGENLYNNFVNIIEDFKPTDIVYPHSNDRHPDHWAVNAFVKYSITRAKYVPEHQWLYLVHRGDWPTPLERKRNMYLTPPMSILSIGTNWFSLSMSSKDIDEKSEALNLYKSQIKRIRGLMYAFERKNELFGEYPDANLAGYVGKDSEISANANNKIIGDPAKDAIGLEINPESDILGLYAETSIEDNIHVFISLDGKPGLKPTYYLNMIFFNSDMAIPLRLAFNNGTLKAIKQNEDSITDTQGISRIVQGKTLHIIIPGGKIKDYDKILMNAESSIDSFHMDRTAWRMVKAQQSPINN